MILIIFTNFTQPPKKNTNQTMFSPFVYEATKNLF